MVVYCILQGQCLRQTFPSAILANGDIPEKKFRVCLEEEETLILPDKSNNIFQRKCLIVIRTELIRCTQKRQNVVTDIICYAEFLRYYFFGII